MTLFESANVNQKLAERSCIPEELLPNDFCMTWKNISYAVERKKRAGDNLAAFFSWQRKESVFLLKEVNGEVCSGTLLAIVGPSGAGKTTLLATISKRIKGEAGGEVLVNGKPVDTGQMIRMSGFVPQKDLALDSLTVQEHLEFMARMKMDRQVRGKVRAQRIAVLTTELGLSGCIGSKLSRLSGGQRKRVGLAVQLLTEPQILFCDEPTTGLDSYAAMAVAGTLRKLAASGRIVICSLHQPASGLLEIFHEVLLLSVGRVAFQGTSADATEFFDSLNLRCPVTYNSAEFYISQLSVVRGNEAESYRKINWICEEFVRSRFGATMTARIRRSRGSAGGNLDRGSGVAREDFKKIGTLTQLYWLVWRSCVDQKRNSGSHLLRLSTYLLIGLLISSPYVSLITERIDQGGIQNVQGLMYLTVVETVFTFNYAVFYTFPRELPLLLREIAGGLYAPAAYYISKLAILILETMIQPVLFALLISNVTGLLSGATQFLWFALPLVLCAASASALGCLISASFRSVETASLFSVPVDFLGLMFCGIYLHLGQLAEGVGWLKYTSQFYYGLEAVSLTHWLRIDRIDCSPDPEEPCISSGSGVLEKYGYQPDHYILDLCGLLGIFLVSHLAGFLVVRYRSRSEPVY